MKKNTKDVIADQNQEQGFLKIKKISNGLKRRTWKM